MRVLCVAVAAVAVAAAASCGGGNGESYPDEAVESFVVSCEAEAVRTGGTAIASHARRICRCVIDEIQKTLPYEEFARYDTRLRLEETASAPDELIDAFSGCTG